jgi:hypothetical protein
LWIPQFELALFSMAMVVSVGKYRILKLMEVNVEDVDQTAAQLCALRERWLSPCSIPMSRLAPEYCILPIPMVAKRAISNPRRLAKKYLYRLTDTGGGETFPKLA